MECDSDKLCFICRHPVPGRLADSPEGSIFEFLCQLFNFDSLLRLSSTFGGIDNSEFCDPCGQRIREAEMVQVQLNCLADRLACIKSGLRRDISDSYSSCSSSDKSDSQSPSSIIAKTMLQCWSPCRVVIPRLLTKPVDESAAENEEDVCINAKRNIVADRSHDTDLICRNIDLLKVELANNQDDAETLDFQSSVEAYYSGSSDNEETTVATDWKYQMNDRAKRKPGRPRENPAGSGNVAAEYAKRGPGRPRKLVQNEDKVTAKSEKRGRGRPRKSHHKPGEQLELPTTEVPSISDDDSLPSETHAPADVVENNEEARQNSFALKRKLGRQPEGETKTKRQLTTNSSNATESDKTLVCRTCEMVFPRRKLLASHLREKHGLDILKLCWFCQHNFESNNRIEDSQKPFKCSGYLRACGRTYETLQQLRLHHHAKCSENPRMKERAERRFKCNQCDKAYFIDWHLRDHIASVHDKTFKCCCEICGSGFQHLTLLRKHMNYVHSDEKRHQCDLCDKSFKRPEQLKYHKRTHTGDLPYVCELCGKGFNLNTTLKLHKENKHSTEQKPCPLCGKLFSSAHYVRHHVESFHKRNPSYMCNKPKEVKSQPEPELREGAGEVTSQTALEQAPSYAVRSHPENHQLWQQELQ